MPRPDVQQLSFDLARAEDLFVARHTDPLEPGYDPDPMVRRVLANVGTAPLGRRRHMRLHFNLSEPGSEASGGDHLRDGLRRFCHARIADIEDQRDLLRHLGMRQLWLGLGMLALCLMVSGTLADSTLPEFLRRFFGEGLSIAGWVVLWRPVETLVFDTGRLNREIELLRAVEIMPVSVSLAPKSKKGP